MSIITYRYRIKDATKSKHLQRLAWSCNTVWNFCNEVSMLALRRDKRWLTYIDLAKLCVGASVEVGLPSSTIREVCRRYVISRSRTHKPRLKWRSRKRSLGWVPFSADVEERKIKLTSDSLTYKKRCYRFWASRPIEGTPKTGSFTEDARGRWYVSIQCEVDAPGIPTGTAEIGIDLGLTNQLWCSDMDESYSRANLTKTQEDALAMAQRAHKTKRVKAIHAKIKNCRANWTHKTTTEIVNRASFLAVGDVSCIKLVKTSMAKSVYDAAWGELRRCLEYKAKRLGIIYREVDERYSSVTCSACLARSGPRGLSGLGVREWRCSSCGAQHHRDRNSAHNILRAGRCTP